MTTVKKDICKLKAMELRFRAHTVTFKDQTRYRVKEGEETQIRSSGVSIEAALNHGFEMERRHRLPGFG